MGGAGSLVEKETDLQYGACVARDPRCLLFPGNVRLPEAATRAPGAQANKRRRHTLAHVTNHNVCQLEENKNLEENSLFSIHKDINKTEAQHCGYSSQEELCSPAKRAEQQASVSPNYVSRDVI